MALITCLFFPCATYAGATDIQQGFLHYKWGDSPASHAGLTRLGDNGEVSYYSKSGEIYSVGDVSIDKVIYGFYKDRLFGVYLNIDSIEVYDRLRDHMTSLYGLPAYKATADNQYTSKWKHQDVTVKLKMDQPARKMKLAFYYRPLASELNPVQWEELDTSRFRFVPIKKDKRPEKFVLFEF